jgi:hypothetical protein
MTGNAARLVRLGAGLLGLATLGWVLTGQAAGPAPQGYPTDWTHRHLIFSQPATAEQAAQVANDPRYWQQWYRQTVAHVLPSEPGSFSDRTPLFRGFASRKVDGDWSQDLGSGASPGAGNFPAKYAFQTSSASCASDYVVFSTGLAGSTNQANIVAYNNLYSGCTGTVPSVYWAYNTGGPILTSPAISGDGTQVAFVQTAGTSGPAALVLLKFAASTTETVTSPLPLTGVANSAYRSCTAPCMTEVFLVDGHGTEIDDRTSSVFPDYTHDIIWVGGALGWLHQITGVFRGNPAEVTTGGYPVQVNVTTWISSPIYDRTSGNVFVGDANGFLYRVTTASPPTVTASGQVDHGTGIVSAPIVDSTAEKVYVFSSSDGSTSCAGNTPCTGVFEFNTSFGSDTTGSEAVVGDSSLTPNPLYEGTVDSNYLASGNATGNLYVCGNTGGIPTLYQIPINAGTMGTVLTGPTLTSAATGCSPVTDVANANASPNPNEWIYASAQASAVGNNCASGGCLMNFVDKQWVKSTAYVVGQEVLDTHFQIQVVRVAGTSKATAPTWSTVLGATTDDGTALKWLNQGPLAASYATWLETHTYPVDFEIVDTNNNIELVITTGTSRSGTHPTWSTTIDGGTDDGTVHWRNVGPIATASIATAGGTGGIIMDNTVGSGTLAGASQVYFSTQSNQTCGTSGTGGCAIQASQSALQ